MRVITIISSILLLSITLSAQKVNPKHVNWYKAPAKIETQNYNIELYNIVAKVGYAKMAVKILNKSSDYLMFNKGGSEFVYNSGSYTDKDNYLFILPNKSKIKTLKVTGDNMFHVDTFKFKLGGLFVVSSNGKVVKANDFKLPASKNNIDAGNFKIKLLKVKQETQETWAKFECTYVGDEIGVISPSKLSVKIEGNDKAEYANDNRNIKDLLLRKGEKVKFSVYFHIPAKISDMQFSVLLINWNDTFKESKAKEVNFKPIEIVVDEGVTNGKNK